LDLFRDTAPQDWVQSCLNFGARSQLKERYQNSNPGPSGEDATLLSQPRDVGSVCPAP
jgi:hypothetical protein